MAQPMPYWKALIETWQALQPADVCLEETAFFPRTALAQGLDRFIALAVKIGQGEDNLLPRLTEMTRISERLEDPAVLQELKHAPRHEALGISRTSERYGKWATNEMRQPRQPVEEAALRCVQTMAAVTMDGLSDFQALGNPFAHTAVLEALAQLQDAVCASSSLSESAGVPSTLRELLKHMSPEN